MSLALARKYRPRTFADVAVQGHVAATLQGAIARGRVAHGYLLCGPRGVGKTTLARVLAMALNCEKGAPGGEPCGECPSCTRIWGGSASLDVVEIDAASNRGVDDARELRERAMYAPSGDDRYKVYIVDEAHMLTREAWNALLKVLEEPPPRVVFVFATTEPQKIAQSAAPVLSRVQRFDLKRIGPGEIRERLAAVLDAEGVAYEPEGLAMIARAADGGLRDALSLTDQVLSSGSDSRVTVDRVREALGVVPEDEYLTALDIIAGRRAADVFPFVARLADSGTDFAIFLTGLADAVRAQLAVTLGGHAPDVSERMAAELQRRRDALASGDLLRMLHALADLEIRFRKSGQQQILIETLLVRFALSDRAVQLEELIRSLDGGSGGGGGGGASPAGGGARGRSAAVESRGPAAMAQAPTSAPVASAAHPASATSPSRVTSSVHGATASAAAPAVARPASSTSAVPVSAAMPAPLPPPDPSAPPPDVHRLLEGWDDVVAALREAGKGVLGTALEAASPVAVSGQGAVLIEFDEPNDIYERAFETARDTLLAILRRLFGGGVTRVALRKSDRAQAASAPKERLTSESVKAERLALLRRRDPVLDAAIEALDLELLD
ncbi:MAG TPA: DNA polymerase III subunit gamma/tau [Gemmatimonadaceae bacterium]|nr:DNA polymerase III subunit gamma/tau [Gemmatimonadaceae bacterium]